MFKGIPLFLLLLLPLASAPFAFADNDTEFVERQMRRCAEEGGQLRRTNIRDSDTQICFDLRCSRAEGEGAEHRTSAQIAEGHPGSSGAAIFAYTNKCIPVDNRSLLGEDGDSSSSSRRRTTISTSRGDGDDSLVRFEGRWYYSHCIEDGRVKSGCRAVRVTGSEDSEGGSRTRRRVRTQRSDRDISVSGDGEGYVVIRRRRGGSSGGSESSRRRVSDGDGDSQVIIRTSGGSRDSSRGGRRYECTYEYSQDECYPGSDRTVYVEGRYEDCVTCPGGRRGRDGNSAGAVLSGIAELAGAIAPPLAAYGINAQWASAHQASNQAWAGAATAGFENCRMMQNNYVNRTYRYIQHNELPDRTVLPPECNGYQLNGFAGGNGLMGNGVGGFGNPWGAAGYSPGFTAGMYGPYGQTNPYGNMGGFNGGNGMGLNIGLGINGMGNNGFNNGLGYNGFNNGMGYNGFNNGMGYNGFNNGMGYHGNMGFQPYGNSGYMGGPNGLGLAPWNNGGGSYWNGSGGWGNGGMNGNANWGGIQQSYASNQSALQRDMYLQQAALGNQFGNAAQNYYSNGYGGNMYNTGYQGYPPYAPSNMGYSMNMGFGFNF